MLKILAIAPYQNLKTKIDTRLSNQVQRSLINSC